MYDYLDNRVRVASALFGFAMFLILVAFGASWFASTPKTCDQLSLIDGSSVVLYDMRAGVNFEGEDNKGQRIVIPQMRVNMVEECVK